MRSAQTDGRFDFSAGTVMLPHGCTAIAPDAQELVMAGFGRWRDRPVFVSSTFGDMQAERDWLREHVLPELEERAKRLLLHLEWVDLRWGVDLTQAGTEEERELEILKLCLADIYRCRPFLIGLLGDRYGWVPDSKLMQAAALAAGYQADVSGRSITALEIEYGILLSSDQVSRSRFWFRRLPYDRMSPQAKAGFIDDENRDRLEALKQHIRKRMPDRVHEYQAGWDEKNGRVVGLEQWGRQVLEHIWQDIEAEAREHPVKSADTWQEQERLVLEQFIEKKCRDFVGREEILARLRQAALGSGSEDWCLCVTGGSGQGKSSLFAEFCRRLEKENVLLLAHAAGISLNSTQVDSLLRRWIEELATFLGRTDPAEGVTSREELEQLFSRFLHQAAGSKRVVCVIDALNQFERTPAGRHLVWLPKTWPENACLFAFAIPGTETEALNTRGAALIELGPLAEKDIETIARTAHQRRRQPWRPAVARVLTGKRQADSTPSAGVPLWLDLALGELLALDADDYTAILSRPEKTHEKKVEAHLVEKARTIPAEVEAIYGLMLDRLEEHHGKDLARAFASVIALGRTGWRLSDLRRLLPLVTNRQWDELLIAGLRAGFRNQLVQRGTLG